MMPRIVFCDFDGTITAVETFAGMLKDFAPEQAEKIMPEMYALRLTLREGVRQMLEAIPSQMYPEILTYCDAQAIRPGLPELLDFLDSQGVGFHVVSGGLRGMVERVLGRELEGKNLLGRVASITAVDVEITGERLRVPPQPLEGDTELVAKVKVMECYPGREWIAIGDSVTDLNMARAAHLVFARDRLITYLEAEKKPYLPWRDFVEVRDQLQLRWC